jgi:hypothetical protein
MKNTCSALIKKNRSTHLSGDCAKFFLCAITGKACVAREIWDENDESSQFFSRAKASFNSDMANKCPCYGLDPEGVKTLIRLRREVETNAVIKEMEKNNNI